MLYRPTMVSDPLSDILATFDIRSFISGGVVAGGAWAIRFPPPNAIKFGALVRGSCWHQVEGHGAPIRLETGDVFIVNGRHPLLLASDPSAEPVDAVEAFAGASHGTAVLGNGDEVRLLGGHVAPDPVGAALLSDVLPPMIHVRAPEARAGVLTWLLDQLVEEASHGRPGSLAITRPLAHLLFVHVLRDHVERGTIQPGWLKAAGDPRIAPAMSLIHDDPAKNWRLAELAGAVGMSRSSFAERFRAVCGMAPLSYLTFWRMQLAESALRAGAPSLAAVSASLGYGSESAFSSAFKRVTGMSPAHYRAKANRQDEPAA